MTISTISSKIFVSFGAIGRSLFLRFAAPFLVSATALGAAPVVLSWKDNSRNETGFRIERAVGSAGAFTLLAKTAANVTTYTDRTAENATSCRYRVRAFNRAGNSSFSNIASRPGARQGSLARLTLSDTNVSVVANGAVAPVSFGIVEADTAGRPLTVTATSSNQALVPNRGIAVNRSGAAGAAGTVVLAPVAGQSGRTTITLLVSDGVTSVTETFDFEVGEATLPQPATAPPASGSRLLNLSSRVLCRSSQEPLIPGFVVGGSGRKRILLRAVGPRLADAPFNLAGTLPNPRMVLKRWDGAAFVDQTSNDNWGTNANRSELLQVSAALGAFDLAADSLDAALLVDLPGGRYTVVVDDPEGVDGEVVVEIYDADLGGTESRLTNMSNRGFVRGDEQLMVSGFVVSAGAPQALLIRAVGPGLAAAPYNLANMNADPMLELRRRNPDGSERLVASSDNWGAEAGVRDTAAVAERVFAFAIPEDSRDAAVVATVEAGVYTVVVRGVNNAAGTVVVEIYSVD